jgi:hypothetical protein
VADNERVKRQNGVRVGKEFRELPEVKSPGVDMETWTLDQRNRMLNKREQCAGIGKKDVKTRRNRFLVKGNRL